MASWASIEDVKTLTGRDLTDVDRTLAVTAIELHTGLIEAVERTGMTGRDRYWLKLAVAYQAVWLLAQPDYLERNAVASVAQDGQSASAGNPDWLTLAPLARKALKKLSWRNLRVVTIGHAERRTRLNVLSEEYDDSLPWRAM
jgi:hypothetical protein